MEGDHVRSTGDSLMLHIFPALLVLVILYFLDKLRKEGGPCT